LIMKEDKRKGNYIFRNIRINIPDKQIGEDPITNNQLNYIRNLAPNLIDNKEIEHLGKWQASALIGQIIDQQEQLKDDIAEGKIETHKRRKGLLFFIFIIAIIIYLVFRYINK
jgi:hypothetical protein